MFEQKLFRDFSSSEFGLMQSKSHDGILRTRCKIITSRSPLPQVKGEGAWSEVSTNYFIKVSFFVALNSPELIEYRYTPEGNREPELFLPSHCTE